MSDRKEALRLEILKDIEKNSRVDLGELAVMLGVNETDVANEMAEMEKEKIICGYHTLIDWDKAVCVILPVFIGLLLCSAASVCIFPILCSAAFLLAAFLSNPVHHRCYRFLILRIHCLFHLRSLLRVI